MIIDVLTVGQLQENCYLVGDPNSLVVIDPGDESERILTHIKTMGYKVSYIILTHCHFDHISAMPELVSETGAKLLLGTSEKENYFSQNVNLSNYFPGVLNLPEPDAVLEDGEILHAGEYSFQVIATPGHTSGSICLLVNDCLFSGDTLFRQSIGRTDLPTGNLRSLVNSIKNRLFVLNDEISVYAGHGPSSNIGYEKKHNEVHEWEKYC